MPPVPQPAQSGDSTAAPPRTIPELSKELHCLNALKKVVEDHYQPRVELAYIAFHPDLDSVSTAKTREAAKKMYTLEAAYELKSIFEQNPDSEILEKEIVETLQRYLHL
ncbi:hypothetical protein EFBL_1495 [Effusibacillus lacus]|uniref:Uncharacterized protein n=2 Tax=Effusibacillus lacus TaxID=1348429 RepID=A0A292YN18_9BACL|nr:hypothetical protein EFBL_1495 [Effusibacillus lacus]